MMEVARMILSELTLKKLPKIPSFSVHLGRTYGEAYKACRRQWDAKELEKVQTKRLRAILKHAYESTAYYRKQFDSCGIKPEDIKTKEDLCKLPILTKQSVKTNYPLLIATDFTLGRCTITSTSGTTGVPTMLLKGRNESVYENSATIRQQLACGIRYLERFLDVTPGIHGARHSPALIYTTGFHRVWYLSIEKDHDYLSILQKWNPTVIFGAPSYMEALADEIRGEELQLHLKAIISTFEMLDNSTRAYISGVLNTDIFDFYGVSEGNIAWECSEHAGYHINADNVIVEILKNDDFVDEGERGEIVVTYLHNYAMPLIRYKLGDVGIFSDELCPCGRKLPLLKRIEGRESNFIVLPDGQRILPYVIMHILSQPMISQYQIIQEDKNLVVIRIVKGYGFNSDLEREIMQRFKNVLGGKMEIRIQYVYTIPQEKSGKRLCVISKVHYPK